MQSAQDTALNKLESSIIGNAEKQVDAKQVMQLNNYDMQQLREQLRLRGQPTTNATLEVRVIPDIEA